MKYKIFEKKTGNLLIELVFYDKRVCSSFLKQFNKLKRQIDVVKV